MSSQDAKIETITSGELSTVIVGFESIKYETDTFVSNVVMSEDSLTLAALLVTNPGIPFFADTIKRETEGKIEGVSSAYDGLIASCRDYSVELGSHFLRLGRSRGTSYAFLDDNSDAAKISYAELAILDASVTDLGTRRIARRQKTFFEFIDLVNNGPKESKFTTSKKTAGVGATMFAVGAGVVWYSLSHRSN